MNKGFPRPRIGYEEQVGQLIMPRLHFSDPHAFDYAKYLIERYRVGSFIVFDGEMNDVREQIRELRDMSGFRLFFGCDAERGLGQIITGATRFPFAMSLGAANDQDLSYRQAKITSQEMIHCGFDMIFAPVLDINTSPDNPIINIRAFGDNNSDVSGHGIAFIKGCQQQGILCCAKHFPGHGGVTIDSHVDLPVINKSRAELYECEMKPFKSAIDFGVDAIMTAHISTPEIDESGLAGTISENIIRGLLIGKLGFDGLVITDSLRMGALKEFGGEEDIVELALNSGCNILLDPRDPVSVIMKIQHMHKSGELTGPILEQSVKKIYLARMRSDGNKELINKVQRDEGKSLAREIARRSVCLLKGEKLSTNSAKVYIFDVTESEENIAMPFLNSLKEAGIRYESFNVNSEPNISFEIKSNDTSGAKICLVYTTVAAWKLCTKLNESMGEILTKICNSQAETILVSFGSPYVIRGFENFETIMCSFDHLDICQYAAVEALLGKLIPCGNLPVQLN